MNTSLDCHLQGVILMHHICSTFYFKTEFSYSSSQLHYMKSLSWCSEVQFLCSYGLPEGLVLLISFLLLIYGFLLRENNAFISPPSHLFQFLSLSCYLTLSCAHSHLQACRIRTGSRRLKSLFFTKQVKQAFILKQQALFCYWPLT